MERLKKITEEAAKKGLGIGEETARKGARKTQEAVEQLLLFLLFLNVLRRKARVRPKWES